MFADPWNSAFGQKKKLNIWLSVLKLYLQCHTVPCFSDAVFSEAMTICIFGWINQPTSILNKPKSYIMLQKYSKITNSYSSTLITKMNNLQSFIKIIVFTFLSAYSLQHFQEPWRGLEKQQHTCQPWYCTNADGLCQT